MPMNTMINESIQYLLGYTLFFEYNKIQKMIFTIGSLLTFKEKNLLYIALVFILLNVVYINIYSNKKVKIKIEFTRKNRLLCNGM